MMPASAHLDPRERAHAQTRGAPPPPPPRSRPPGAAPRAPRQAPPEPSPAPVPPAGPAAEPPQAQGAAHLHGARTQALASHARFEILDALTPGPRTIRELSLILKRHRVTLRYHLGFLLAEGLVEELPEDPHGRKGRPAVRYRVARHARIPGFPPRRFEFIAQAALASLLDALGSGDASLRLHAKGKEMGLGVIRGIAAFKHVRKWTPATFDEHILKGSYREMGVSTEVIASGPRSIEYRAYGCPFLELAEQMPDVVCDALDRGFHDGMDEALGGASTERRMCMGHGDLFCEYVVSWPRKSASPGVALPPPSPKEAPP